MSYLASCLVTFFVVNFVTCFFPARIYQVFSILVFFLALSSLLFFFHPPSWQWILESISWPLTFPLQHLPLRFCAPSVAEGGRRKKEEVDRDGAKDEKVHFKRIDFSSKIKSVSLFQQLCGGKSWLFFHFHLLFTSLGFSSSTSFALCVYSRPFMLSFFCTSEKSCK